LKEYRETSTFWLGTQYLWNLNGAPT